jgi:CubicO group peptidase (beta-lactamase class C family)
MWSDLERLVEASMHEWKIPGLALAVVRDGEVVHQKGYGVRDMRGAEPVTPETQFLLCSITKSFTAAGLGLLVDEGKLEWTRPVREVIPEFRLQDALATERLSVRDLLCHRSGLPRHDWVHMPGDLGGAQMLPLLRHLAPSRELRDVFQYSNLGYMVAGMVTERLSGQRWEDFTTERLLKPLGFQNFGFTIEALEAADNAARPHVLVGDECMPSPLWPIRTTAGGGMNVSLADIAKWARFLLNEGKVNGLQLLSAKSLREMCTPHVHMGRSEHAEVGDSHYGFGLFCENYRGDRTYAHSGSWLGWGTLMTAEQPLVLLAQQVLLHLAHGVARQLGHHEAALGNLEVGQLDFSSATIWRRLERGPRLGDHDGHAHLAEIRVRHADQRAFGHAGMSLM